MKAAIVYGLPVVLVLAACVLIPDSYWSANVFLGSCSAIPLATPFIVLHVWLDKVLS